MQSWTCVEKCASNHLVALGCPHFLGHHILHSAFFEELDQTHEPLRARDISGLDGAGS